MSAVDPGVADWLRTGSLFATAVNPAAATQWPEIAIESEITSALALKAGAEAEAARQLGFMGGPLALDVHVVPGLRTDLIGKAITITAGGLGYEHGRNVLVIDAEEAETMEQTTLAGLRRLD